MMADESNFGMARDSGTTQTDIRAENQKNFLAALPPKLRELWEDPEELIAPPPDAFFRESDPIALAELRREFHAEIVVIARKYIAPQRGTTYTELTPGMLNIIKREVASRINEVETQEYALERIKERHNLRYKDALTGELSKTGLEQRFYTELKRLETLPDGRVMVLIEFDIDSFKKVNEMLGHAGADKMIIELTRQLKSVVSELDSIGRRSGDELSIILNNVDPEALPSILQRITSTANSIEFTREMADRDEHSGQFMSITGSARIINKGDTVSYEQASAEADAGATFQKVNKPNSIVEWSPDLRPDLSSDEKREKWAEKLANNEIKRITDKLYSELRRYDPETETDKIEITNQQIQRLEDAKEIWIQHYLAQIEKDQGPLTHEKLETPDYATSQKARENMAASLAHATLRSKFNEYRARLETTHADADREAAAAQLLQLNAALEALKRYELRRIEDRYGDATAP